MPAVFGVSTRSWVLIEDRLAVISGATKGEAVWPPPALFKAMLLAVWFDLPAANLAAALDDRFLI